MKKNCVYLLKDRIEQEDFFFSIFFKFPIVPHLSSVQWNKNVLKTFMGFCLIKLECEKRRRRGGKKEGAVIRTEYCFVFTFLFDWFGNGERRRRKRKTVTSYSLFSRHCLFEMVVWESGNFAPLSWLKEKKGVIKNNIKKFVPGINCHRKLTLSSAPQWNRRRPRLFRTKILQK